MIYLRTPERYPLQLVMRQVLLMNQSIGADVNGMSVEEMADLLHEMYAEG